MAKMKKQSPAGTTDEPVCNACGAAFAGDDIGPYWCRSCWAAFLETQRAVRQAATS